MNALPDPTPLSQFLGTLQSFYFDSLNSTSWDVFFFTIWHWKEYGYHVSYIHLNVIVYGIQSSFASIIYSLS